MKKTIVLSVLLLTVTSIFAQTGNNNNRLSNEVMQFFAGRWHGEGAFANGKKITANLSFQVALDSSWLQHEHTDELPGRYKANAMWGIDKQTGEFVAYCFDNTQGHRQFTSAGWKEGKLLLTNLAFYPQAGPVMQHFIYEKQSNDSFKMTYETSRDGITWKMIDYLVFTRLS